MKNQFINFSILTCGLSLLVGCEFGNKSEVKLKGYDLLSGYYATSVKSYRLFKTLQTSGVEQSSDTPTAWIPDGLAEVLKDPTVFYVDDPFEGLASVRSHVDTGLGFSTIVDQDAKTFGKSSEGSVSMEDGNCTLTETYSHAGSVTLWQNVVGNDTYQVRGQLQVDYESRFRFSGNATDCRNWKIWFKGCYENPTSCNSEDADYIQTLFDPFINPGFLTIDEIPDVQTLRSLARF